MKSRPQHRHRRDFGIW